MCSTCESQFATMVAELDLTLDSYRRDALTLDGVRNTPAKRVHDLAGTFYEHCESGLGRARTCWYLAVLFERMMAMEAAGIPT